MATSDAQKTRGQLRLLVLHVCGSLSIPAPQCYFKLNVSDRWLTKKTLFQRDRDNTTVLTLHYIVNGSAVEGEIDHGQLIRLYYRTESARLT